MGGLRTAVVGGALGAVAWALISPSVEASPAAATPAPVTISFAGTATDGTALELTAQITEVTLNRVAPGDPGVSPGGADSDFLSVSMTTEESAGTGPSFNGFDAVPVADIDVALPGGATAGAEGPGPQFDFLDGTYSFVVPASTTTATLEVAPGTVGAVEYPGAVGTGGELTSITFEPSTAAVVVSPPQPPGSVPVTTVPTPARPKQNKTHATSNPRAGASGFSASDEVGAATGGGLVVLVLLIPLWRRRAYRKADAEGRVIIDAPPPPATASSAPVPEVAPVDDGPTSAPVVVVVKVLGPVQVDGLVRPIELSPEREVLVFLALHPGRSFTSGELRSAIWVEGRTEPTAGTFHNYISALRRSLPAGSLVWSRYHYSLTAAVTSDWGRYCAVVEADDDRAERLAEALNLVRGPPFDGAFSGRNSPYGWAGDLTVQIEAAVEKAGHEVATAGLESGDLAPADAALARVLVCLPTSVVARQDHIRLGSVLGGPREVARRMRSARSALGDDADALEPLARSLG